MNAIERTSLAHCVILAALLSAMPGLGAGQARAVIRHTANLHPDPSKGAPSIRQLSKGDTVTLLGTVPSHGYVQVATADGDTGWVYRALLRSLGGAAGGAPGS